MMAIGVGVGCLLAVRVARRWRLPEDPVLSLTITVALAGLVGGKLLYIIEHGDLFQPGEWFARSGFSFNGGFLLAAIAAAVHVRAAGLSGRYLDALAFGLPLGVAVGRIGDVINGEHYGPRSDWLLAVRNSHPDADVPSNALAYHSGGLYEVLLGLAVFAVVWPLRDRLRRPYMAVWLVIGLFAIGRFVEFFWRSDSDEVALGLSSGQWSSLLLLVVALAGAYLARRGSVTDEAAGRRGPPAATPAPGTRAR